MNITTENHLKVNPIAAMIVYNNSYIETCEIKDGKLGAKKPLTIKAINLLKKTLKQFDSTKNVSFKGYVSSNLIYLDSDPANPTVMWSTNAQFRTLLMNGIEKKRVHIPKMIWCYWKESLYVFAIKKFHKDIAETKLYKPPFPNVVESGSICFGNVKLQEQHKHIHDIIREYENAFFNSYFTEPEDELKTYWENANDSEFDYSILKPYKKYEKIKNVIAAIERSTLR